MSKNKPKDRKVRPAPKPNRQISISAVRKAAIDIVMGSPLPLRNAREYPIHGCWIMRGWKEAGMAPVVIARRQDEEHVLFADIEVDLYCLGVKDSFANFDFTLSRFERELPKMCALKPEKISVELAHEIVYGGLEYASKLGFEPHPDFKRQFADQVLDPPDAHPRENGVVFGKDGKPFYVTGPYDDEMKIKHVVNTLKRAVGEGNFDILIGFGDMEEE